jgi:hypothetical protein
MDEILRQIPPAILVYAVLIPVLAFGLMAYFAILRPMLKKRGQKPTALSAPAPANLTPSAPVRASALDDLPDLDLLLAAPAPVAPAPVNPNLPRVLGEATVTLVSGQTVRAREELAILRDPSDGRLLVQLPGAAFKSFASAPASKEAFSRLMTELAKSLSQPDDAPAPAPVSTPTPPPVAPPPPLTVAAPPPPMAASNDGPLPGDLPKYRDMQSAEYKGRGLFGQPKFAFQPIPDLDIPSSIEAYLQYRLAQTPGYGGRPWHVRAAPGGGVRIEVNGQFFEAVSDITDPDARAFIQNAIQEWQERQ